MNKKQRQNEDFKHIEFCLILFAYLEIWGTRCSRCEEQILTVIEKGLYPSEGEGERWREKE